MTNRRTCRGWDLVILAAAWSGAFACSSPQPQTGTNTNWACQVDADCAHAGTASQGMNWQEVAIAL